MSAYEIRSFPIIVDVMALILGLDSEPPVQSKQTFTFQFVVGKSFTDVFDSPFCMQCCLHDIDSLFRIILLCLLLPEMN